MPKVGDKHFSYDPSGIAAARAESAKTGVPMKSKNRYAIGGLLDHGHVNKGPRRKPKGTGLATRGFGYRIR